MANVTVVVVVAVLLGGDLFLGIFTLSFVKKISNLSETSNRTLVQYKRSRKV